MDAIGAEVGQKMRSAIKAKLMELGCYVDDELPDYIMVMVANKRTRIQMEDDLQLFLRSDTKIFVEWLQQVLKKLKEVTITNPEVCSTLKELKRKASIEIAECVIKKEKKDKKLKPDKKTRNVELIPEVKSISDEIPVQAIKLVEKRNQNNRLHENAETSKVNSTTVSDTLVNEDNFDIPSLAEVNDLEDSQLDIVENKIKEARNRIVLMKSDSEDDDDFINIRADTEDLLGSELDPNIATNPEAVQNTNQRILKFKKPTIITKPITERTTPMSERLGPRPVLNSTEQNSKTLTDFQRKRSKISLTETLREEQELLGKIRSSIQKKPAENKVQKKRESVHKRLGLPSSVVSLLKKNEIHVDEHPKSVMSVVQVRPRRNIPGPCQANKNLLLKAVAEAQKSVTQTPMRGNSNSNKEALFTKKYREKLNSEKEPKLQQRQKIIDLEEDENSKLKNIIIEVKSKKGQNDHFDSNDCNQFIPESTKKDSDSSLDETDYIPSAIDLSYDEDLEDFDENVNETDQTHEHAKESEDKPSETNQQFIVTLDGIKDKKFLIKHTEDIHQPEDPSPKQVVVKRAPSPIIFNKPEAPKLDKTPLPLIPEKLPKIVASIAVKAKERCKYWPNCRLKDNCEFVHPHTACKMFPLCKFGDKCLFIHPKCKFDASCTRKDCPYSHGASKVPIKSTVSRSLSAYHVTPAQDICKYFPNCSNPHCLFYHPKPCRFGKYCLNKTECNFSHGKIPNKEKLTWHSNGR